MKPITALIIDDEALCRKGIRLLVEEDADFRILGECADGREAVRGIAALKPDMVFLDIQMPEAGGFDVLKALPEDVHPLVVFVTAYDEHAVRAFEVQALDYVLKPFTKTRFQETLANIKTRIREKKASDFGASLKRLIENWEDFPAVGMRAAAQNDVASVPLSLDRLLLGEAGAQKIVWIKDIEWIEGADYYVQIHTRDKSYLYRERLKNLEHRLPPRAFIRVHKSAIINLHCLDRLIMDARNRVTALLSSGNRVRVSRSRKQELIDRCRAGTGRKE
jgi:two-component system, LytTR family, response regulator